MDHRVEIGKRIKKLRQERNFSQTYVAEILFISQAAYSLIESSQNGIVADHIIKLSKLYGVSTDYILKGDQNYIKIGRSAGFIPLIRARAHEGFLKNLENEEFYDIKDWFRIPGFDPINEQTLFEVEGESMSPTIFPGDVLICQLHHDIDKVLDGSTVVVITVDGIMVKRFKKSLDSDYLILESDNVTHGNTGRVLRKDVKKILMIRGKISNVLISHQDISSSDKIKNLEKSIDLLKSELFKMNAKLNSLVQNKK